MKLPPRFANQTLSGYVRQHLELVNDLLDSGVSHKSRPCANALRLATKRLWRWQLNGYKPRRAEGRLALRLHLCDERFSANDLDRPLQVVSQNLQAHLGSHSG